MSSKKSKFWNRLASRVTPFKIPSQLSLKSKKDDVLGESALNLVKRRSSNPEPVIFSIEDETRSVQRSNQIGENSSSSSSVLINDSAVSDGTDGSNSLRSSLRLQTEEPELYNIIIGVPLENGNGESGESVQAAGPSRAASSSASESSSCRRRRLRPNQVSFDIDDVGLTPTSVESYLSIMFFTGLSPFMPDRHSCGIWRYGPVFLFAQLIIFWIITILTIMQTLVLVKIFALIYLQSGGLEHFTNMGFYILSACTKVYSAYLFTLQQRRFAQMLLSINRLRAFARENSKGRQSKYPLIKVILLSTLSFVIAILPVVFASGLINWTPSKTILFESTRLGMGINLWTGTAEGVINNGSQIHNVIVEYGTNMTTRNMVLGIIGFNMDLFNRITTVASGNLILSTAITLQKEILQLATEVDNPANDINPVTLSNFELEDGQWAHYGLLKKAIDDTNSTFDSLLRYTHVNNVMLLVYLAMNVFDGWMPFFLILLFIYIIKLSCTYRIATKASENNETFRKWIRRLAWKSTDKEFITKAFLILDQMKEEPFGFGKGQFMIDESFMFRFFGSVGSVFVLQAQARESSSDDQV